MLNTYAKNKLTWPVALGFTFITWILNGWLGLGGTNSHATVLTPFLDYLIGMGVCAVAIYMIAELNTRYSLIGNNRTISTTLMLLLAMSTFLHPLQRAHVVMVCHLIACLILFDAYQSRQAPVKSYAVNLCLGIASLAYPQLIWLTLVNLATFVLLRASSLKSIVAALLGVVTPYWFWKGVCLWTGDAGHFHAHTAFMTSFGSGGLSILPAKQLWAFWVVLAMFLTGAVDFFMNIHQNRSRTRINYYVVCLNGGTAFLFLWIEPQLFLALFPLCIIHAAILWGHFCTTAKGRIPDIVLSVVMLLLVVTTLFIS